MSNQYAAIDRVGCGVVVAVDSGTTDRVGCGVVVAEGPGTIDKVGCGVVVIDSCDVVVRALKMLITV